MEQIPFPNKKYQIVYADPPWSFNFQRRKGLSDEAKGRLYPTMNGQDIINLPVKELAADNAVLFLWVMNSELPLAFDVIKGWGFFLQNGSVYMGKNNCKREILLWRGKLDTQQPGAVLTGNKRETEKKFCRREGTGCFRETTA